MLYFDETKLAASLARYLAPARAIFAAACAERLVPAYLQYAKLSGSGNPDVLIDVSAQLWRDLANRTLDMVSLSELIETCKALLPGEEQEAGVSMQAQAEDAVAAMIYALQCRQNGTAKEAVWAARRAYEALDSFVIDSREIDTNAPGAEQKVLQDVLIQSELKRQFRDLKEIENSMGLIDLAFVERFQDRCKFEANTVFELRI